MRRRAIEAVAAAVAATALAAPATSAGAVTIGSDLGDGPGQAYNCNNNQQCTVFQRELAASSTAPGGLTSPVNGTVLGFRVNNGPGTVPVKFRVVRPFGGGLFSGAGTGPAVTPPANQISPLLGAGGLPISIGDSIGLECCMSGNNGVIAVGGGASSQMSTYGTLVEPPLGDGVPAFAPDSTNSAQQLLLNADIEPTSTFMINSARLKKKKQAVFTVTVPNDGVVSTRAPQTKCKKIACRPKTRLVSVLVKAGETVEFSAKLVKGVRRAAAEKGRYRFRVILGYLPEFGSTTAEQSTSKLTLKR